MHEVNLSRTAVSGPADVSGAVYRGDLQYSRRGQGAIGNCQTEAWTYRVPRLAPMLWKVVEDKDIADYNELRDGYEALLEAHAQLLLEMAVLKGEHVRYPLAVPDKVAVDVIDKVMQIL